MYIFFCFEIAATCQTQTSGSPPSPASLRKTVPISPPTLATTAVLSEVLSLVEEKQTRSLEKRGKFKKPSGEVVILRDLFEKTAKWLHKFREIGDVVAQYDPVHTPFRHLAGCCYEKSPSNCHNDFTLFEFYCRPSKYELRHIPNRYFH